MEHEERFDFAGLLTLPQSKRVMRFFNCLLHGTDFTSCEMYFPGRSGEKCEGGGAM